MHSELSVDADGDVLAIGQGALAHGVTELALTEHLDLDPQDRGHGYLRYDRLQAAVARAQAAFGGDLLVRSGLEVTYQREYAEEAARFLARNPVDFVLGSVHIVDGRLITAEAYRDWGHATARAAHESYFALLAEAAATGLFDSLGHLDLPRRYAWSVYGPWDPQAVADQVDQVLATAVSCDVLVEVNASGLRHPHVLGALPGADVLARYVRLGGRAVTVGSDAHRPAHVGVGVATALAEAAAAGIREVGTFSGRRRQFRALTEVAPGGWLVADRA